MNAAVINKRQVAGSFSRAALSYDAHASLQRQAADTLLARVDTGRPVRHILDLGAGTGYATPALRERFPEADIVSLDIAEGMLCHARARQRGGDLMLCADAESLPLANASIDLIFSSLAVQWCSDYPALFRELARVMRVGGQCLVSSFGPATLQELKAAWAEVDEAVHVNEFAPPQALLTALAGLPVSPARIDLLPEQRHYPDLRSLGSELKAIGAHNMNAGQPRGLMGRERFRRLSEAFARGADRRGRAVTWELLYLEYDRVDR